MIEHYFQLMNEKGKPTVVVITEELMDEMSKDKELGIASKQIRHLLRICDRHDIVATITLDPKSDKTVVKFDREDGMNPEESIILATELAAADLNLLKIDTFKDYKIEIREVAASKHGKRKAYSTNVTTTDKDGVIDFVTAIIVLDKDGFFVTSFDDHREEFYPEFKDKELRKELIKYCESNDWKKLVKSKLTGIVIDV